MGTVAPQNHRQVNERSQAASVRHQDYAQASHIELQALISPLKLEALT